MKKGGCTISRRILAKDFVTCYDTGRREMNQDSLSVQKMQTKAGEVLMAILCDGIGGLQHGEMASGYIVETLTIWFYDELPFLLKRNIGSKALQNQILKQLYIIHGTIKNFGKKKGIHLGSTLSMLLIIRNQYYFFYIGDGKAVHIQTKHSPFRKNNYVYNELSNQNVSIQKKTDSKAGVLTSCIGCGVFSKPIMKNGHIREGDGLFMSTDGLLPYITGQDILALARTDTDSFREHILRQNTMKQLLRKAYGKGGGDNMSAIYIQY
ncbi:MAG: PP2C family protein-serine/threonine phosphatase [Lachnospiraceae bacterium]